MFKIIILSPTALLVQLLSKRFDREENTFLSHLIEPSSQAQGCTADIAKAKENLVNIIVYAQDMVANLKYFPYL